MKSFDIDTVKAMVERANAISKKESNIVVDDFAKNIIDKVFNELAVIFPAWKVALPSEDELDKAKLQWTKAFVENGISTIEQIQYGFKKARSSDTNFLPSCGRFISWCTPTPQDLGYPCEHDAMKQCVAYNNQKKMFNPGNISVRPFIVELCKRVDWWMVNNASTNEQIKRSEKHFKDVYLDLIQTYVEPVEIDAPRLPTCEAVVKNMSEEQKRATKERSLSHIEEMKKKLKGKNKLDNKS